MQKNWICLGLMSGTSGDGVDASIINTNGINHFELIKDEYYEYDLKIYKDIHNLKEKIHKAEHLKTFSKEIDRLEREITIFQAKIIKKLNLDNNSIIGFHGQTIYHNPKEKISRQLGNAKLLNQLTKKMWSSILGKMISSMEVKERPLTPIFHQLLASKHLIKLPVCFLNIGGISNITIVFDKNDPTKLFSRDIGPGNCLMRLLGKS